MNTDDLISMLASGGSAVEAHALRRRYMLALGWAAFGATLLMSVLLGVRPDLWDAVRLPMFWVKLAFPLALAAIAIPVILRLSRPGAALARLPAALLAPPIAVWLLAAASLLTAAPAEHSTLVFGDTWTDCLVNIGVLALPALIALMWALKGAAPTRPALAGAAAGLCAGAIAAAVYALHCPELAAPFIGVWYVLGMLTPTALGAIAGPRLLRW